MTPEGRTPFIHKSLTRRLGLVLGIVLILLAAVAGGFLGAALGRWVAVVWDLAVIALVILVMRQRAIMRDKRLHS